MSDVLRYIEVCQYVGPDITAQSISFESNCVFKKLQTQDLNFTVVKSLNETDTNVRSSCESLQSLELHITALDWIMVTERNLAECESNCLGDVMPYSLVHSSKSLHKTDTCITKLYGVACWKILTFTLNVLQFTTLRNR
jgi:hypothetical protein